MELWTGAQHAFVVKAFNKNCDNFVIAEREFRTAKKSLAEINSVYIHVVTFM